MKNDLEAEGLRGVAALSVFFAHFILTFLPGGLSNYFHWVTSGKASDGPLQEFLRTPVLSSFWNGRFAVCVFFVLSGYVLTNAYHASSRIEVIRSLASRRYLRLGIPVMASVMLAFMLARMGLYRSDEVASLTGSLWLQKQSVGTPTVWNALWDATFGVIFQGSARFNTVFWTMRVEFIGSLLIFAYALICGPSLKSLWLSVVYFAVIWFFAPKEWPFYLAFLIGSQLNVYSIKMRWQNVVPLVVAGAYLAGFHDHPWYAALSYITPYDGIGSSLWGVIGGALLVASVRSGAFRFILMSRLAQYLGRISYPLYLVHAPIIMTFGCGVYVLLVGVSPAGVAITAAFLASILGTLAMAEIFYRFVDMPAIRWSKKVADGISLSANKAERTGS